MDWASTLGVRASNLNLGVWILNHFVTAWRPCLSLGLLKLKAGHRLSPSKGRKVRYVHRQQHDHCARACCHCRRRQQQFGRSQQLAPEWVEAGAACDCERLALSLLRAGRGSFPGRAAAADRSVPNPLLFHAPAVPASLISSQKAQSKGFPPPLFISTFLATLTLQICTYSWPQSSYWVTFKILLRAE